jgi:branched-chain amino acid transport system permease protein
LTGRGAARPWRGRLAVLPALEVATLAALLILPGQVEFFTVVLATKMMLLAMLALSFDLNWGYSGIMSFGQALFFGTGAYVVALMGRDLGLAEIVITLPVAALAALALALAFAWFLLLGRRTPSVIFVALGTLTGSYAAERLVNASQYLGGRNGLSGVPILSFGPLEITEGPPFYYLALGFLVAAYLLARFLVRSQLGLVLAGMRDQERRLAFLGYRVQLFKAIVFATAGMIAGVGGALFAYHEGAVLGTFAIEGLSFYLADSYQTYWPVVLGLVLLLVVVFRRTGLLGLIVSERERVGDYGRPPRP